jgi:hypothetical protein
MDMLISNLLKASGVDPEKVKQDVQTYAKDLAQKIGSMDASMAAIREEQSAILQSMEEMKKLQSAATKLLLEISRATARPTGTHANGAVR